MMWNGVKKAIFIRKQKGETIYKKNKTVAILGWKGRASIQDTIKLYLLFNFFN